MPLEDLKRKTSWIWLPDWSPEDDADARIVCFRKELVFDRLPDSFPICITADSRYKLFVNGRFVQEGPAKGDLEQWFLDRADLATYLIPGTNVIACEVLRYPLPDILRNHSLYRTQWPCLYVKSTLPQELSSGALPSPDTISGWKCRRADQITLVSEKTMPAPLHILEHASGDPALNGWKLSSYDDSAWSAARPYSLMETSLADAPFNLADRPVPPMRHQDRTFEGVVCVRETSSENSGDIEAAWNTMLKGSGKGPGALPVVIPAHTRQIVEISAGTLQCGYPVLSLAGGRASVLSFIQAESYVYPASSGTSVMDDMPHTPLKGDRSDYINGHIEGHRDQYTAGGFGTGGDPEVYEPFWFRTFRYVRIEIETKEQPLSVFTLYYRSTGYPFDLKTRISSSDQSFPAVWDISLRTLRRCMHETYMDCPYYEQLQYTMDSRSEILFTYCTTADDRLARRCMDDFRRSQRADGLLSASAPVIKTNVIPGFSIYYILMLHDHMMYFGDSALIESHFPTVERILSFFDKNLTRQGLVGSIGGPLFRSPYWSFVDWAPEWSSTIGVPSACQKGSRSVTMESLLYLYGLQKATDLASFLRREDCASLCHVRASRLSEALRQHCMGTFSTGNESAGSLLSSVRLLQDGPGIEDYSIHCQVFAILTGIVSPEEGRKMLKAAIYNPQIAQASVSFMFYLFRALEITGWYEKADDLWELWREMVKNHLTTCVENTIDSRSDCHAWASVLLYELPSVYLGVRPAAPGYSKVCIRPVPGHLSFAEGQVITPRGIVFVSWKKESEKLKLSYTLPEGMALAE